MAESFRIFIRLILRTFFRDIEIAGLDNIPNDRGGIVIACHPNGLIDPALMFAFFPRPLVFGARHGLFKWPLLGAIMRKLGTVPIFRGQDVRGMNVEEQRNRNQQSLNQLSGRIVEGAYSALFPEGVSHDDPFVQQLKTGAARIYCSAWQKSSADSKPVIIPVGLHYDCKQRFRSNVLIQFHPPMELPNIELEEHTYDTWKNLTSEMEDALEEVIHATESWELHRNLHRASLLIRAERLGSQSYVRTASIEEQVIGMSRLWTGYQQRKEEMPEVVERLIKEVQEYRLDMEALGLMDHQLDGVPRWISRRLIIVLLLQTGLYILFLPPLLFVGYAMNFPTTLLIRVFSTRYSTLYKDKASVQLFSSLVAYPFTWFIWGGIAYWGHLEANPLFPNLPPIPIASSLFVFSIGILSCVVMFVYLRAIKRTLRGWKVRWVKKQNRDYISSLLERRNRLTTELIGFAEGLDLPGELGPDNRLRRS